MKIKQLSCCPKCGMDSARRLANDDPVNEMFYVVCETCRFAVKGKTVDAASRKWEAIAKRAKEEKR